MARRGPKFTMFFDTKAVMSAVDRGSRSVLSKFGSFVRTTAQRSMRPASRVKLNELHGGLRKEIRARKRAGKKVWLPFKASKPGEPPRTVTKLLRKLLFFGYDTNKRSVVVGPSKLNSKGQDVPRLLEEGGTTAFTYGPDKGKRIPMKPRPYMGPALRENLPQLPQMWRNAIK